MHVLFVCSGFYDFVWYIYLVLFMIAGIDEGEGLSETNSAMGCVNNFVLLWYYYIIYSHVIVLCFR
jgi:hypothetical protein